MKNERDYVRGWAHEGRMMEGYTFRLFKWTKDFDAQKESSLAPQWIFLPKLPMHLYRVDCLQILATRFGRYLGTEDATINRTRATGARICVEVDLLADPVQKFPIVVSPTKCIWQEAIYEKLGFYCLTCFRQGHTSVVCRVGDKRKEEGKQKEKCVWLAKTRKVERVKSDEKEEVAVEKCNAEEKGKSPMVQAREKEPVNIVENYLMTNKSSNSSDEAKVVAQTLEDGGQKANNQSAEKQVQGVERIDAGCKALEKSSDARLHVQVDKEIRGDHFGTSDEECEEIWHDDTDEIQGSPTGAINQVVQTKDLFNETNNPGVIQGSGLECNQQNEEVGYSSAREEGELCLALGKEKAYESEGDACVAVGAEKSVEDKLIRKSQQVQTRSKKLNL